MLLTRLRPRLQNLASLTLLRVRTARICKLKGRRAAEFEEQFSGAAGSDIHDGLAPLRQPHRRHAVDSLGDRHGRFALGGAVLDPGDGEDAGLLGEAAEGGTLGVGATGDALEGVEDGEGAGAGEGEGESLPDAVVRVAFQRGYGRRIVHGDLDARGASAWLALAAA